MTLKQAVAVIGIGIIGRFNPLIAAVAILRHTFYYPPVPWAQYSDHKTEKTVMFDE
jgi:hypothetical protein